MTRRLILDRIHRPNKSRTVIERIQEGSQIYFEERIYNAAIGKLQHIATYQHTPEQIPSVLRGYRFSDTEIREALRQGR